MHKGQECMHRKRAQVTVEVITLTIMVIVAVLALFSYLKSSLQGRYRQAAQTFIE